MMKEFLSENFVAEGFTAANFIKEINFIEQHTFNIPLDLKDIEVTAIINDESPDTVTVVSMVKLKKLLKSKLLSMETINVSEKECYHFPKKKIDANIIRRIESGNINLVLLLVQGDKRTPIFLDETARSLLVDKLKGRGEIFYGSDIFSALALQGLIDGLPTGKISNFVLKKANNTIVLTSINKVDSKKAVFFDEVEEMLEQHKLIRFKLSNYQYMVEFELKTDKGISYRLRINQTSSGVCKKFLTVANKDAKKSVVIQEVLEDVHLPSIPPTFNKNIYQLLAENKKVVVALGNKRLRELEPEARETNTLQYLLSLPDKYTLAAGEELLAKGLGELVC